MSDTVKRARSPNYPAISLPTAIQQLRLLFDRIHKHKAPKEAILKGLGYGGWNGASATALSAHTKYGILDRLDGDDFKISDLGMRILFHNSPAEYTIALHEAAKGPPLFAELMTEFPGTLPHEDILRPWLIRRGFAQSAVATVIDSYRETMEFVSNNSTRYSPDQAKPPETTMSPQQHAPAQTTAPPIQAESASVQQPPKGERPYKLSFNGETIEVGAVLMDAATVDKLIAGLNAMKTLLPETEVSALVISAPSPTS